MSEMLTKKSRQDESWPKFKKNYIGLFSTTFKVEEYKFSYFWLRYCNFAGFVELLLKTFIQSKPNKMKLLECPSVPKVLMFV